MPEAATAPSGPIHSYVYDDIAMGVIDVGSPSSGNLGWVVQVGAVEQSGSNLDAFIEAFALAAAGRPAALGFEAPLFIPIRNDLARLTSGRAGEGSRSWSAGAGPTVMAIGMAVMGYTFQRLRIRLPNHLPTLDWTAWPHASQSLLIFEAFVSAKGKGRDHCDDARVALTAFRNGYADLSASNAIQEENVLSLAATALLWSGWPVSPSILHSPALVIKAAQQP